MSMPAAAAAQVAVGEAATGFGQAGQHLQQQLRYEQNGRDFADGMAATENHGFYASTSIEGCPMAEDEQAGDINGKIAAGLGLSGGAVYGAESPLAAQKSAFGDFPGAFGNQQTPTSAVQNYFRQQSGR